MDNLDPPAVVKKTHITNTLKARFKLSFLYSELK